MKTGDFGGNNGVAPQAFDLTATCSSAVSAAFTFAGTADTVDGVRFANTSTGTGAATGVGIWFYSTTGGNTDIPANGTTIQRTRTVNLNATGTAVLPLAAAYWRVGTVTTGSVSTQITVTMAYT